MKEQFDIFERLYRAVYPPNIMPMFWKENGELSSAVFKDKNGLSVDILKNLMGQLQRQKQMQLKGFRNYLR